MHDLIAQNAYLLSLLIFLARVTDVSLGTFRTIAVFRGQKLLAASIGFFEIIIWLVAASQVLTQLDRWYLVIAYAAGFSVGNYVGIWIEGRFAIGLELVRCISFSPNILANKIRTEGFKVISTDGDMGSETPVEVMYMVEKRCNIPKLIELIKAFDHTAIYTVSDVRSVYDGPDVLPKRTFMGSALLLPGKRR